MKMVCFALFGAGLLVVGSTAATMSAPLGVSHQACTADIKSLCAGITGQEKIRQCFLSRMDNLSAACADDVSNRLSVVKECATDVTGFCGSVKSGDGAIAKCLKGHLQDLSRPCRAQLAQMAAPSK